MAKTKANEIRNLSLDEIIVKRKNLEKELGELRHKKVTGQLDKPHLFRATRFQIAQLNTIEKEKNADRNSNKK